MLDPATNYINYIYPFTPVARGCMVATCGVSLLLMHRKYPSIPQSDPQVDQKMWLCFDKTIKAGLFGLGVEGLVSYGWIDKSSFLALSPIMTTTLTTLFVAYTARQTLAVDNHSTTTR